jgi:hypothetical protein
MVAVTEDLLVGKVGNVYLPAYGTTSPFTLPPAAGFDIDVAALAAAWTNADLGYLHEDDTPEFGFETSSTTITAWQANGNVLRTLQNGKVRSVKFTVRAFNRVVWDVLEPGTVWTAQANGTFTGSVPSSGGNPPRAGLFEVEDLDNDKKVWWYVPRLTVASIGTFKASNTDSMNAQLTLNFEVVNSTDPIYYVAGNHPGLAP